MKPYVTTNKTFLTTYYAYRFFRFFHHFSSSSGKHCFPKFHNLGKLLFKVRDTYSLTTRSLSCFKKRKNILQYINEILNNESYIWILFIIITLQKYGASNKNFYIKYWTEIVFIRDRRIYWKVVGKIRILLK